MNINNLLLHRDIIKCSHKKLYYVSLVGTKLLEAKMTSMLTRVYSIIILLFVKEWISFIVYNIFFLEIMPLCNLIIFKDPILK